MKIGKMRHRIILLTLDDSTTDSYGQPVKAWTDGDTVHARVEPLSGRELEIARQTHPDTTYRFTLRYVSGFTSSNAIEFDSEDYNLLSVINTDNRNIELVCLAVKDG